MRFHKCHKQCIEMLFSMLFLFSQIALSQSGSIDFEDSKWSSVVGHRLYHGGPDNTLTDQEMGADFIIAYGEMMVQSVTGMGRMLFFSPIISSNGTTDDVGRVLIQFDNSKQSVQLDVSHDYTEVHTPASMTVKFYKNTSPVDPLHTESIPWNSGAFTTVEYTNSTDGIQMVIVDTKYAENNIDNIEFTAAGGEPSNLTLTVISASTINLNWQDNSDSEQGFAIERKTGSGGSWSQIGTVTENTTSYQDNSLGPNTTYYYRVRAFGSGWFSPYSDEAHATTLGMPAEDMFDFNDGTNQGWTIAGAYDEDFNGPFSSAFTYLWVDNTNYPNPPGNDALGDDNGSISIFTYGGHGVSNPGAEWWIMRFYSPDLSNEDTWQAAKGYTVEIAECMANMTSLYANLNVVVYDQDQDRNREFFNGNAQQLEHDSFNDGDAEWNHLIFSDWTSISGFPENYTVKQLYVNIFGKMNGAHTGGLYLDEVVPIADESPSGAPDPPSNLQVHVLSDQFHIFWQDNSDDEQGFILEHYSFQFPATWTVLDTLDANITSFQMDNPTMSVTHHFRVKAFNENGNSDNSNEVEAQFLLSLSWIGIDAPDGGEIWSPGSIQEITWRSSNILKPTQVNIWYSTDMGSNWIEPPIASNYSNTGSCLWTIPDTPSENCILKIADAADGSPYDLSHDPFTIGEPTVPILSVTPQTLDFGTSTINLTFEISNTGAGSLTWSVAENPDKLWMTSVSPQSGTGDATITVQVNRDQLSGDNDTGTISVSSNGGDQDISVLIEKEEIQLPENWTFIDNTGNNANIILPTGANPNIDGSPLEAGDCIGVFTSQGLCCGWSEWQDQNTSITVWGDNSQTPEIDGFQAGETIKYRIYRPVDDTEWTFVTVTYSQGDGLYSADAIMIISQFDVTELSTITLNLQQGWNLFSINVNPSDPDFETIMAPVEANLVILKNSSGQTYIPEYDINNIGELDVEQGYKGYFNQAASLAVTGSPVDPETPISLSGGWDMIAYLPDVVMDIETALAVIVESLVIAKDGSGKTYIPEYDINQIGQMLPGQGYQLYLDAPATLIYPSESPGLPQPAQTNNGSNPIIMGHFQFTQNTGENATVVIPKNIQPGYSDGNALANQDEVGVFNSDGLCCGAAIWEGENTAITVWGNDSQTDEVDGFETDDTLTFYVYDQSADCEYPAIVNFVEGDPETYQTDGFSVLTELTADVSTQNIRDKSDLIPKKFELMQNYPNPFNPSTCIDYAVPEECLISVKIYNMLGREVSILVHEQKLPGEYTIEWFTGDLPSGIYLIQLEAKNYCLTKKVLLTR